MVDLAKNDPVLITGGTGFIGSRLARRLVQKQRQVHLLVRENSKQNQLQDIHDSVQRHIYSGSTTELVTIVGQIKPRLVFHLASNFISEHRSSEIELLIASNVLFGTQLLEAMAVNDVKYIVNTGTAWQHYESEFERAVCLYAATKIAFEKILKFYVDSAGVSAITLELFDTYGPNDPRKKIFWHLHETFRTGRELAMSPGEQLLDLVYIDDVIDAFETAEMLLFKTSEGRHDCYGVSSGERISLRQLVETYENILQTKLPIAWGSRSYRRREVMRPWSGSRILPGWTPDINLQRGLELMKEANLEDQIAKST